MLHLCNPVAIGNSMEGIDPKAFEFALSQIEDGFIFEDFSKDYLGKVLGYSFLPVGGIKDRGIDGLEHFYCRENLERNVYQASIEKNCVSKLEKSIEKLVDNKIKFNQVYFVTNQIFPNKDKVIDELFEKYKKPIHIYDLKWMSSQVNTSPATVNSYHTFVTSYLHEFQKPGKSFVIGDLVGDPRLFVFLSQQWEAHRHELKLDEILSDTLILFSLEGTDPDKNIFKTKDKILQDISNYIKFDPKQLHPVVERRLSTLCQKPRKIRYHSKENGYCLPYETRLEIQSRNFEDAALYAQFKTDIETKLKSYLKKSNIVVRDCASLIEKTLHKIFHQQGLEFADFVLHGENQNSFEKNLPDIISLVVDESSIVSINKEEVKPALLIAIRDMIYNGTLEQKMFLKRLSNTYMMLFLLQCDPKLALYFNTMASQLNVYVCTSILVPALSEYFLEPRNRRHSNLLKGSRDAGVTLIVNETILNELVSHFRMITNIYEKNYRNCENLFLGDEFQTLFIEEIMIRAYFYAKRRNQVKNFNQFIDSFVNPDLENAQDNLIEWLKEEFGIIYKSDKSLNLSIDQNELNLLSTNLKAQKKSEQKAKSDSKIILTIYSLREKNNETNSSSIFGYKTWWLSKDTLTQKEVIRTFKDKYKISCYIRPDFLYNYISLAPSKIEVDSAYRELFPSFVGVNISFFLPKDVVRAVHQKISKHKVKNKARLKASLRDLAHKLQVDPNLQTRQNVELYLDERLKEVKKNGKETMKQTN